MSQDAAREAVRRLGSVIGYGNMIDIAHSLWDEVLLADHQIVGHSTAYKMAEADIIRTADAACQRSEEQVKAAFMEDFDKLLKIWGAEIQAKDHYTGYPECGEDIRMTISIPAIYEDFTAKREQTDIDLGFCHYPK